MVLSGKTQCSGENLAYIYIYVFVFVITLAASVCVARQTRGVKVDRVAAFDLLTSRRDDNQATDRRRTYSQKLCLFPRVVAIVVVVVAVVFFLEYPDKQRRRFDVQDVTAFEERFVLNEAKKKTEGRTQDHDFMSMTLTETGL